MDFFVALDKDNKELINGGKTVRSNIIYIPPGHVALLSLYNMTTIIRLEDDNGDKAVTNKSCLTVKKLSFGRTGDIADKLIDMCKDRISITGEHKALLVGRRVFREPVYQNCCEWTINPANNFVLIPTPGFYELETDDVDQLDTAYVEFAILTADQAKAIPDAFKLGNNYVV